MSFALQGLNFASDINLPPTHPFRPSVCILVCLSACKSACTSNISLSTSALVCAPSPRPPFNSTVRRHVQWSTLKGLFSEKRFLGKLSLWVPYIKPMKMRRLEGCLRRSKRRRHLPKIRTFKNSENFCWQTDRHTDRHTDRQTDRQTLWFIGKLHFQKGN